MTALNSYCDILKIFFFFQETWLVIQITVQTWEYLQVCWCQYSFRFEIFERENKQHAVDKSEPSPSKKIFYQLPVWIQLMLTWWIKARSLLSKIYQCLSFQLWCSVVKIISSRDTLTTDFELTRGGPDLPPSDFVQTCRKGSLG